MEISLNTSPFFVVVVGGGGGEDIFCRWGIGFHRTENNLNVYFTYIFYWKKISKKKNKTKQNKTKKKRHLSKQL